MCVLLFRKYKIFNKIYGTQDFEHQKFTKLVLDWWNRWSFELNWYAYFWKLSVGIYKMKIFWNCSCCFHQLLPQKQISSFAVKKSLDFSQTIESYKPLTVLVPLSSFSRLMLHACDLNLTTRSHAAHTFIILVFVHQTSWQKKGPNDRCGSFVFQKTYIYEAASIQQVKTKTGYNVCDVWTKEKQIFSAK